MVGRKVSLHVDRPPAHPGEPVLIARDLHVAGPRGKAQCWTVWVLRCGEAKFSVSAVWRGTARPKHDPGAGRSALSRALAWCCSKGEDVTAHGADSTPGDGPLLHPGGSPRPAALVLPFSLTENLLLGNAGVCAVQTGWPTSTTPARANLRIASCGSLMSRAPSPETRGWYALRRQPAETDHRSPSCTAWSTEMRCWRSSGRPVAWRWGAIEFVHKDSLWRSGTGGGAFSCFLFRPGPEILDLSDRIPGALRRPYCWRFRER